MMALLMIAAVGVAAGPRAISVSGRLAALLTRSDAGGIAADLAADIARLEGELETLAARRNPLDGGDSLQGVHGTIVATLAGMGTHHGLRLMRLEPRLEAHDGAAARLVVEAGFRGRFYPIVRFLGDLEARWPWMRYRRLAIVRSDGDPARLQLQIELSLPVVSDE